MANPGRARRLPTLPLILLALTALVAAVIAWVVAFPPTRVVDTISWEAALVAPDGRSLVLTFVGADVGSSRGDACWEGYEPLVVDAGDHVEVTLQRLGALPVRSVFTGGACNAVGYDRTVRAELPTPLAGRPVHDTYQRRGPRPTFDGAHAIGVEVVPAGSSLVLERVRVHGPEPMLQRSYELPGADAVTNQAGPTLQIWQSAHELPAGRDDATVAPVTVHGLPAQFATRAGGPSSVDWREHEQWIRVAVNREALSRDELVAVAEGTRVP